MIEALYFLAGVIVGIVAIVGLIFYSAHLEYKHKQEQDTTETGNKYQSSIKKYIKP
jgi:TRAP-type C4-dicarboxylate transport system permease large subunit